MNIALVVFLFLSIYAYFLFAGLPISRLMFPRKKEISAVLAPLISLSIFGIFSTIIMYHCIGYYAGLSGSALLIVISMLCLWYGEKDGKFIFYSIRQHYVGIIAGLIFLLPLFLTNDRGIFALNGADFGSYAGWGSYFSNHTLIDGRPSGVPINSTLAGFANLQQELAQSDSKWRVGCVSLFAALNAHVSERLWPTLYMVFVAFILGQFSQNVQIFSRYVLLQNRQTSRRVAYLSIWLNTIAWLAMSHYTPNIVGITFTLGIITLALIQGIRIFQKALALSILTALIVLVYPENLVFIILILSYQFLIRLRFLPNFRNRTRIKEIFFTLLLSSIFVFVMTAQSFFTLERHFFSIFAYNRPGDYVGIYFWSYPSQLIGFVDYDSILRQFNNIWMNVGVFMGYVFSVIMIISGYCLWRFKKAKNQVRSYIICGTVFMLFPFAIPIGRYVLEDQWLVAWRSLLTLSPYVWILLSIFGIQAFQNWHVIKKHEGGFIYYYMTVVTAVAFLCLIGIAVFFRIVMVREVIVGGVHAAIFGEKYEQAIQQLKTKNFDLLFIEYEGSGTKQAGWEFYAQNLSYIFPEHGSGRNEYSVQLLRGKSVAVMGGGFKRIQQLSGFDNDSTNSHDVNVLFSDRDNILLPYSSTWIYFDGRNPCLCLPGLPGKFLFWSKEDTTARLVISAHANRKSASLAISINGGEKRCFILDDRAPICLDGNYKKGLNVIRFEPLSTKPGVEIARAALIRSILNKPNSQQTEYETGLLNIYYYGFQQKDPTSSALPEAWGKTWNLITPEDVEPLNPHVIFDSLVLRKTSSYDRAP